jgi:pimeloyl-ACP methyl ester carboxylesterase
MTTLIGTERLVRANGVEICTDSIGDPTHPAILLVQGACASMIYWDDDFCGQLVAGGRFVIRADCRDQGQSTVYPPGAPSYDLDDLADDAVALLDEYGVPRVHVVGGSSGGMVAQLIALRHPERLATMTLICSTPTIPGAAHASAGTDQTASDLPGPHPAVLDLIAQLASVDWSDPAACVEASVVETRVLADTRRYPLDEPAHRRYAAREYARQRDVRSFRFNTPIAETRTAPWRIRLGEISTPTLVVHGTDDPVLPYPHGVALAREIPGAELVSLDGVGHGLPRGCWPTVVPAILARTADVRPR